MRGSGACVDTPAPMGNDRKPSRAELGESVFVGRGGRTPRMLALGEYAERGLAIDEQYLYWSDDRAGEVTRLPKDGGIPMVLAQRTFPRNLTLADGHLYWSEREPGASRRGDGGPPEQIVRMPADGGPVEVIARDIDSVNAVVVRGREVVVLCDGVFDYDRREEPRGMVLFMTLGEARPQVIASKQRRPESAVFVGDELYWLNGGWKWPTYFADGALLHTKLGGPKKRWVVHKDLPMAGSLLADDTHLYWTTTPTYHQPALVGAVHRRPRGGGATEELFYIEERDGALLAQDATDLYCLIRESGTLVRVPKDGGDFEVLMTAVARGTLVQDLTVDDRRVYWVVSNGDDAGGAVWSIAKAPAGVRREEPDSETLAN